MSGRGPVGRTGAFWVGVASGSPWRPARKLLCGVEGAGHPVGVGLVGLVGVVGAGGEKFSGRGTLPLPLPLPLWLPLKDIVML